MTRTLATVTVLFGSAIASPTLASPAGGALYRPMPLSPAVAPAGCETGQCQSGACPGAGCKQCALQCVDPASPPPCAVDGTCRPKTATFGYYRTRWRRWPTDIDADQPTAAPPEDDALLAPIDPPPAEEEDQQAPPPIDEPEEAPEAPAIEIEVPSVPAPRPPALPNVAPPGPPAEGGPPALPFGAAPVRDPSADSIYRLPDLPTPGASLAADADPRRRAGNNLGPPALPPSLARRTVPASNLRRLPGVEGRRLPALPQLRRDSAVLPAGYRDVPTGQPAVVRP